MMIGDRPGQCLVSDGFETKTGRADKAKPIQTGKFAIHTLGLGCVETRGDFSSRSGFTPLQRLLAAVDRFSGFSAYGRFWRAPVPWNGDLSR
jgi:hypothetical protein